MRIPFEWLKDYVAIRLAPKALAERMTMAGLEVVGIEDAADGPVLDCEITPNRADCLSIIGIAREVAAITGQRLKSPQRQATGDRRQGARKVTMPRSPFPVPRIRIEDRKGCQRYIGRLISGVTIGPSPQWMQRRLLACGARPINNIVDITNYVLFEYGQPLHAFDFRKLAQGMIRVRRAHANEPITALDGIRRTLSSEMLVIADAAQAVAVAGVMGGIGSEVTSETTDVLLESALFDPVTVRRTARVLGLATESSYRFERGVDPVGVATASQRAAALIRSLAGGTDVAVEDAGSKPSARTVVTVETSRVQRLLGAPVSASTIRTTLAKLSCHVASSGSGEVQRVAAPSFRRDLTQEIDLAEELARLIGYERLPCSIPSRPIATASADSDASFRRAQSLRRLCAGLGLSEAITWSLVSEAELSRCGLAASSAIRLANPLSQDHTLLRPSLVVGLLSALRRNATQGVASIRLFELGQIFTMAEETRQPVEQLHLGIILAGAWMRDWQGRRVCDFFRLSGILHALANRFYDEPLQITATSLPWAAPQCSAALMLGGRRIGVAGQVARSIAQAWDLEEDAWFAEVDVPELFSLARATAVTPPPMFPPVKRDLSLLIGTPVDFASVHRAICDAGAPLARHVELIDRYVGPQVPAGQHSLTFSIEYRDPSRTLTAAEVDARHQRIGQMLVERFGARLR